MRVTNEGPLEVADRRVTRPDQVQRKAAMARASAAGMRVRCTWCGQPSAGYDADGAALCSLDLMVARQRRTRAAMRDGR
jgi:hypothetical protein